MPLMWAGRKIQPDSESSECALLGRLALLLGIGGRDLK